MALPSIERYTYHCDYNVYGSKEASRDAMTEQLESVKGADGRARSWLLELRDAGRVELLSNSFHSGSEFFRPAPSWLATAPRQPRQLISPVPTMALYLRNRSILGAPLACGSCRTASLAEPTRTAVSHRSAKRRHLACNVIMRHQRQHHWKLPVYGVLLYPMSCIQYPCGPPVMSCPDSPCAVCLLFMMPVK